MFLSAGPVGMGWTVMQDAAVAARGLGCHPSFENTEQHLCTIFAGGSSDSRQSLQAMCNPNAHATAFEARVWLSVKTGGMSVATEAKLSAFRAALEAYFEQLRTSKTVA